MKEDAINILVFTLLDSLNASNRLQNGSRIVLPRRHIEIQASALRGVLSFQSRDVAIEGYSDLRLFTGLDKALLID